MEHTHSMDYATNGTLLIQSGVNIKDVADHMGHSSTRVTERYLHAADKNLAERVNSRLASVI